MSKNTGSGGSSSDQLTACSTENNNKSSGISIQQSFGSSLLSKQGEDENNKKLNQNLNIANHINHSNNDFELYKNGPVLGPNSLNLLKQLKTYETPISAFLGGICSTTVGFPLDSVKTRMQAYKFKSVWNCITVTHQTEGIRGFFRGLWAPLISTTCVRTVSFSLYVQFQHMYTNIFASLIGGDHYLKYSNEYNSPSSDHPVSKEQYKFSDTLFRIPIFALAGLTSGGIITVFACPFEFTKLASQIEVLLARAHATSSPDTNHKSMAKIAPKSAFAALSHLYSSSGFFSLYSGFKYHFFRDSIGTAIYFSVYETSKAYLSHGGSDSNINSNKNKNDNSSTVSPLHVAISGGLCGIISWLFVFPIDTIKSIYQRDILTAHYAPNNPHAKPNILKKKSRLPLFSARMYRGLGVSVLRTAITNMTFFSVYEFIHKQFARVPS